MRIRSYSRFSTDRQSESSITDQQHIQREYAAIRGWLIEGEFSDEAISGAALGNRPGAQAALAALQHEDILLLTDLTRLARSQDLAPLITRLRHRGVRVIGIQDGFDSDSRTARMQAGLSGIMSEEFRAMVADRTRSALEIRARAGQPTGGKAYENVEIVREIFGRFAAGETMKAIASDLNRRGVPSPGADWKPRGRQRGKWLVSALHALLHNERYIGKLVWNRSQWVKDPDTGKRHRRERPESEWIVQSCEALIDAATWARAQARFTTHQGRGGVPSYLLSGLLECALCGSKLIVVGGSQRRYVCGTNHAGGDYACSNRHTMTRKLAEQYILTDTIEQMLAPQAVTEGVRLLREERTRAEHVPQPEQREVAELERLVREGVISAQTAAPALVEARRRAREAREPLNLPWPSEKLWRETVENMREVLQGEDIPAARALLREHLGTIPCRPEGKHIVAAVKARQIWMQTGNGISVGSGGVLLIHIPTSTRGRVDATD